MEELYDAWVAWSSRAWPLLVNHLWQSTLFALALVPAALLLRRAPARLRYALSLLAAAKFLLPSALVLVLLDRLLPGLKEGVPASSLLALEVTPSGAAAGLAGLVPVALTGLWLAGTLACAGLWLARRRAFARTLRAARVIEDGPQAELLARLGQRLRLRRRVALALLPGAVEPGVWRIWRPLLVLPEEMPRYLTEAELEAIFLHELIHVRRWDNLVANLQMAVCCLFWFYPLVWLLDRRLLAEREEACDEGVLELSAAGAGAYLSGLVKAVRFGIGWRLAGISSAHASNFRRRIERIRAAAPPRPVSGLQRGLLTAAAALLCAFTVGGGASAWQGVPCATEIAAARCSKARPVAAAEPLRLELPATPPPAECDGDAKL